MKIIVMHKNNRPFYIEIDGNKTILELKKEIAKYFNETYTGFNILNGNEIIDSSENEKTINECGIRRLIRLPDDYCPGFH